MPSPAPMPAGRPLPVHVGTLLVEVTRSGFVESVHHGSVIALDGEGKSVVDVGDTVLPVLPRSSSKPMQALASLRSGLEVDEADLAQICASHRGEPMHIARVLALLARFDLTEDDLQCPPDLPGNDSARSDVIRAGGGPRRVYMNCSGKHAGMLAACVTNGWPTRSYRDPDHPLQQRIRATIEELARERVAADGVDGCGAPVLAISLSGLARAFTAFTAAPPGTELRRIADAMRARPELVAGTGEPDTVLMSDVPGLLMKGGAEGVHAAALPDGSAVALKIADGSARARMPVLAAALERLGVPAERLAAVARVDTYGAGQPVGRVRLLDRVLN